jgi:hypothetical protein
MIWVKRLLATFLVLFVVCTGVFWWKERNDGFNIKNVYTKLPNKEAWELPTTPEKIQEVNQVLAQTYHYLGQGFQFYAFESKDSQYVLKFLRHQRLHPPVLYDYFPDIPFVRTLKQKKSKKREDRLELLFESLKIAYEELPEETGLIYVQLNKPKNRFIDVFLVDTLEDEYSISLNDTEFVLQRKAEFLKPCFKALMKAGKVQEAKIRINQIFDLLKATAKKGILDTDGALIKKDNIGFLEDRAIYIDVGRFVHKEAIKNKERFVQDLRRLRPLYKWLMLHYPPLAAHFDRQKKLVCESF